MLLAQSLLSGITAGSIYSLVALGFVLIYKSTRVVHFGLGDQVTLGAYIVIVLQLYLTLPFYASVPLGVLAAAGLGFLIQRVVMEPISTRPVLVQVIATLAIGLVIREGLRAFMGPQGWPFPFLLSPAPVEVAGLFFAPANLAILGVTAIVMVFLYSLFAYTTYGKAILAVCENRTGAYLIGIPVPAIISSVWMLAAVLAAVAGILIAPIITLSPDMGLIGIKGFAAATLGGFASLPGAVLGGVLLGVIETLTGTFMSTAVKDGMTYLLLIAVIMVRPHGLLGTFTVKKV